MPYISNLFHLFDLEHAVEKAKQITELYGDVVYVSKIEGGSNYTLYDRTYRRYELEIRSETSMNPDYVRYIGCEADYLAFARDLHYGQEEEG